MKDTVKLFVLLIFAVGIFAFACESNKTINSNANSSPMADKQNYKSVGVIRAIDASAGKITIEHEDIPGYMSAMEMNEVVSDKQMLETAKVGDKVEFEIERTGAKIIVTKIKKIGEVALLNGGEIYRTNCAKCHGSAGEGADKGIPLIKGHALHHNEQEYIEQVKNGEGKRMPAFNDKLANDEITAVVKFVRKDLQKDVRQNEKTVIDQHDHH